MGCDIHVAFERYNKDASKWELHNCSKEMEEGEAFVHIELSKDINLGEESFTSMDGKSISYPIRVCSRNYILFGALTGSSVRRDVEGAPNWQVDLDTIEDFSPEIKSWIGCWDCDGHSHGVVTISDYKEWLATSLLASHDSEAYDTLSSWYALVIQYFQDVPPEEGRIVFFFDN